MNSYPTYGLLGRRLSHSFSRTIHERISPHRYQLIEIEPEDLNTFLKRKEFQGINVTIPYKQAVLPYLDEIDPSCLGIGACNCITNHNGKLTGYNTDYFGIARTFEDLGVSVQGKKVLILGNGGAMKAFQAYCRDHGARDIQIVYHKDAPGTISYQSAMQDHADAQILINATPVGMDPYLYESPVDLSRFPDLEFVFDAIYNPLETKLIQQAKKSDIPYTNGLFMLVEQARKAHELFLDRNYSASLAHRIFLSLLSEQANIVLTGMPSSGKSTLGSLIAKHLRRPFYDSDELIEKQAGMSIPEIFEKEGEEGFREREKQMVKRLSRLHGSVISLGGGTILDPENVDLLQQNSLIVYLDRPLELLTSVDENRPLLKKGIENLYHERKDLYRQASDLSIMNNGSLDEVLEKLSRAMVKPSSFKRFYPGYMSTAQ